MSKKFGRPVKYQSSELLEKKISEYFENTKEDEITISGLCLYLKINKDTFYEYAKKPEFKEIISMARLMVEHSYELSLRKNGRTGDIFALKNFGWKDKQEEDGDSKVTDALSKVTNAIQSIRGSDV